MWNGGGRRCLIQPQCLVMTIQSSEQDSSSTELCNETLSLGRMGGSKFFVLVQRAFIIVPFLWHAAKLKPDSRRHFLTAQIEELLIIQPSRFVHPHFGVQHAEFASNF